jgi:acyl-CoA synthetase (AMP-forming)/AMP-acid ligase II
MLGYWRRPEATAAALADGRLHTGDVGSLDENGRLTISGRRSELILRGGANVYPVEVEAALLAHPDVAEAAVYGLPDERLGEKVAAAIVATAPAPDLDAIRSFLGERIAAYKVPVVIEVLAVLPRNAMGKVVKGELGG